MQRSEAFDILRRIRDEFSAAQFAVTDLLRRPPCDLQLLKAKEELGLTTGRFQRCAANLEITYIIRLFCEFEAVLLDYWEHGLGRPTRPKARVLMERIAAGRGMAPDHLTKAHDVRAYRNEIVHEGSRTSRLSFRECSTHLGRFASWLPTQW